MRNRDLYSSLFWIVFGILFVVGAMIQGLIRKGVPGPGFLPFISGILLIGLSCIIFFPALLGKSEGEKSPKEVRFFPESDSLKKISIALISLFAFGFFFGNAGYLITIFLFMLFIMRRIEPVAWKIVLITALATALFSYLLFEVLLEVPLPKGILEF